MNQIIDKLNDKAIFITGASGLICSTLIDQLMHYNAQGYKIHVYAISRNEEYAYERFYTYWKNPLFTFIRHDVVEPLSMKKPIDYIIHGASNASPKRYVTDPVGTMKANIWGIANLLDLAKEAKARLLYISSGEIYGEGDGRDFTEDYSGYVNSLIPRSCYPSSKRASETLCVSYKEQYNTNVVIARPCHIYGMDTRRDDRAFAQFLRSAKEGKDIILKSAGKQVRSYCHVEDCASALLYILLRGVNGEAYNIANRESVLSIKELSELIAEVGKVKMVYDTSLKEILKGCSTIQRAVLDPSKLEKLGWKALIGLREGINKILTI